ncbi:MAG: DUF1294 domain-containing protein [Eubacterium sp.]
MIKYLFIYLLIISFLSSLLTVLDKRKAVKNKRRISENTLILTALIGGAFTEYITMKLIRHKTLHKKFMIGLPCIIIFHIVILILIFLKVAN